MIRQITRLFCKHKEKNRLYFPLSIIPGHREFICKRCNSYGVVVKQDECPDIVKKKYIQYFKKNNMCSGLVIVKEEVSNG